MKQLDPHATLDFREAKPKLTVKTSPAGVPIEYLDGEPLTEEERSKAIRAANAERIRKGVPGWTPDEFAKAFEDANR